MSGICHPWIKEKGLKALNLPQKSPDFSIFESLANPLKRKFRRIGHTSNREAMAYFHRIFDKEVNQTMVQNMYNRYPRRLQECRDRGGQMTH